MDDDLFYQGMDHDLAASIGTFFTSFDMSGLSQSFRDNFSMDATRLLFAIQRGDDPMRFAKPVAGNNFGLGPRATGAVEDITLETVSTFTGIGALGRMAVTKFGVKSQQYVAKNLSEQLVLKEAQGNGYVIMKGQIKDLRYRFTHDKMQFVHEALDGTKTTVHYWRNRIFGTESGFKIK